MKLFNKTKNDVSEDLQDMLRNSSPQRNHYLYSLLGRIDYDISNEEMDGVDFKIFREEIMVDTDVEDPKHQTAKTVMKSAIKLRECIDAHLWSGVDLDVPLNQHKVVFRKPMRTYEIAEVGEIKRMLLVAEVGIYIEKETTK